MVIEDGCWIGHGTVILAGAHLGKHVVVASPLYKNHFDLSDGVCLEAPEHSVRAHSVRVEDGRVLVALG